MPSNIRKLAGKNFMSGMSLIFDVEYQSEQLRAMRQKLLSDHGAVYATIMAEKLRNSFGLEQLPSLSESQPIITFEGDSDDDITIHTITYFNSSQTSLSPYTCILEHYYGREYMIIMNEVYNKLLNSNETGQIVQDNSTVDSEESSEENSDGVPATISRNYLNQRTPSPLENEIEIDDKKDPEWSPNAWKKKVPRKILGMAYKTPTTDDPNSVKKYICNFKLNKHLTCGKTFKMPSLLKSHISKTHNSKSKEKNHVCNFCNACFAARNTLRNHIILIHTKDYPHRCSFCSEGFIAPSLLKKHEKLFHQIEEI